MSGYDTTQYYDRYGGIVPAVSGGDKGTRCEKQRAHWSVEGDSLFVSILAKHTMCDEKEGILINHKYVDPAIIDDVSRALSRNVAVDDLVQELAIKYPNKKEDSRSHDSVNLMIEMKGKMPAFNYQQLNHKHINMWTRTISPFRMLYLTGNLYRGKSIFHKDYKRFTKVLMEFNSYVIINGLRAVDPDMFTRKAGKGSKLLEQWLTAMLNIHKQRMANFLYKCGIRLACTYLKTKPAATRTDDENNFLDATSFPPKSVQAVLKEYSDQIAHQDGTDQADATQGVETCADDDDDAVDVADVYTDDRSEPTSAAPPATPQKQPPMPLVSSLHRTPEPAVGSQVVAHEPPRPTPIASRRPILPREPAYSPYARPQPYDGRADPRYAHPMQPAPPAHGSNRAVSAAAAVSSPAAMVPAAGGPDHYQRLPAHRPHPQSAAGAYPMYPQHHAPMPYDMYAHPRAPPAAGWPMGDAQYPAYHGHPQYARQSARYQPYQQPQRPTYPSQESHYHPGPAAGDRYHRRPVERMQSPGYMYPAPNGAAHGAPHGMARDLPHGMAHGVAHGGPQDVAYRATSARMHPAMDRRQMSPPRGPHPGPAYNGYMSEHSEHRPAPRLKPLKPRMPVGHSGAPQRMVPAAPAAAEPEAQAAAAPVVPASTASSTILPQRSSSVRTSTEQSPENAAQGTLESAAQPQKEVVQNPPTRLALVDATPVNQQHQVMSRSWSEPLSPTAAAAARTNSCHVDLHSAPITSMCSLGAILAPSSTADARGSTDDKASGVTQ